MRYRKRPVEVRAVRLHPDNDKAMFAFMLETNCPFEIVGDPPPREGEPYMVIHTLEGDMTALVGDWLIQGVAGEFYPCKPEIFATTYEPVDA